LQMRIIVCNYKLPMHNYRRQIWRFAGERNKPAFVIYCKGEMPVKESDLPAELVSCIAFHGHLCPGLIIGYKAALAALPRLSKGRARDEELVCITMTDSCAIDAIQLLTGCTAGKGNLIFRDFGKMVFLFLRRGRGSKARGVRIAMRPKILRKPPGTATLADREAAAAALLAVPPEKLFTIRAVTDYSIPGRARIFPSQPCAACGELTMEPRLRVKDGKMLCAECAPEPYSQG
jgi:formylmethanofuran dehydrogenase subunit E